MPQYQENVIVTRVEQFFEKNYRLTLDSPGIAESAKPGQFVMIRTGSGQDPLLRRPFSIHQTSANGTIQVYFKVVGRGTDILAHVKQGEVLSIFGPLGQGFRIKEDSPAVIIGGGLGIAPMLFLAKTICRLENSSAKNVIILGGRQKSELEPLLDDFREIGITLYTATDDGSLGYHGNVADVLQSVDVPTDCIIYSCGPEPMLASIAEMSKAKGVACQVSVESVMACGMGACLGCSKPRKDGTYTHVCLNGPVFNAEELEWNI
jgi:dihydroorotate dehydrogenase electron transfer subunit